MNSRPWRFRARAGGVELLADPVENPTEQRQRLIACGAALYNLRLAVGSLDVEAEVSLLPEGTGSPVLACVGSGRPRPQTPDESDLLAAISRRRTRRAPFDRGYLPRALVDHLAAGVAAEGALLLSVTSGVRRESLDALLSRAQVMADRDPAHRANQRAVWSDTTANTSVEVLCTDDDGPRAWLRTGQALQRLLLSATASWAQVRLFTLALEDPVAREMVRREVCEGRHPQLVLELGSITELSA